jgi:peptidoglycan hydrolase-like protein with peptidoglycan-binding domain
MVADGFPTQALLDAARVRAGTAPPPRPAQPLDRAGIRELQRLLNRLGFDAGRADGRIGPKTRAAIRAFEGSRGLAQEGRATSLVLDAARAAAG